MKEIIIKYKDSRVLELLRSLSKYFDFLILEEKKTSNNGKKKVTFSALKVDTRGYKFNREEANER